MRRHAVLRVDGLHGIELDELTEAVPPDSVETVEGPERSVTHYGELTLITVALVASGAAIQALSAWLSRRAARNQVEQGFTIVVEPGGTVRIELANLATPAGGQARPSTAEEIAQSIAEAITSAVK
ncbi:hypothetical protein DMB66_41820 [Actinoplanes sp. ATCC 53533]|uniref:hypothetical protein n=1 Tax=Actinoplanes sp. ATCC 53533 TaxID=1288362 RepID=UPI000F78A886|nr:hypothetical protein [Actinoplanes sp. ATCC 53533]RSM51501.1 hypothetical protein DMB66_41820 [Actinoplanes sp. ATCC 53533]